MNVLLNGIEINKELLTVNDGLNYGRFFDKNTEEYEIQLTDFEVIAFIKKEYIETRDAIKVDDEMYEDRSDFTHTKYCSLEELLKYEADFESIMKTYFHRTLFKKIFHESPKNRYVINSTDSIKIIKDRIVFKGKVFELLKT